MIRIIEEDQLDPAILERKVNTEHTQAVKTILDAVRTKKDEAVREYTASFDKLSLQSFAVPADDIIRVTRTFCTKNADLYKALCRSYELALRFARYQKEPFDNFEVEIEPGLFAGQKVLPVDRAGCYVPAGRFPLLSSVIMTCTPAIAAGVKDIVLCSPPRPHPSDPSLPWIHEGIMAVAGICGIKQVYACGGAQAVAALAYGTESIPRCDVIAGPGNAYVAEAKRLIYGDAGIDMIAGPTEVFIIADETANPVWLAADMLAQAEHDSDAQAILVTCSRELAAQTAAQIEEQLAGLATADTARASIEHNGMIIIARNYETAGELANKKAPEHLELAMDKTENRDALEAMLHNYGTLFIGNSAAEVLGDYTAGVNHTLPTAQAARYTGGLSVRHFLKTVTTLRAETGSAGVRDSAAAAAELARAEGLIAHARAAEYRLQA